MTNIMPSPCALSVTRHVTTGTSAQLVQQHGPATYSITLPQSSSPFSWLSGVSFFLNVYMP